MSRPKRESRPKGKNRPKRKSVKTGDEIRGYELHIAGDREDAERAADDWGVRIRILDEGPDNGWEVWAVCPREDVAEILAWHDVAMLWFQAGHRRPRPGMLSLITQPPTDEDITFTEKKKPTGPRFLRSPSQRFPRAHENTDEKKEPLVDPDAASTVEFDEL
jgi:hypothetical protein